MAKAEYSTVCMSASGQQTARLMQQRQRSMHWKLQMLSGRVQGQQTARLAHQEKERAPTCIRFAVCDVATGDSGGKGVSGKARTEHVQHGKHELVRKTSMM